MDGSWETEVGRPLTERVEITWKTENKCLPLYFRTENKVFQANQIPDFPLPTPGFRLPAFDSRLFNNKSIK